MGLRVRCVFSRREVHLVWTEHVVHVGQHTITSEETEMYELPFQMAHMHALF
jgi:hypothetical protein